jgi:hypothetical protein
MNVDLIRDYLTKALAELEPPPVVHTGPPTVFVKQGDNLQAAVDACPDGGIVRVQPGTYDGLRLTKAHAVPITIRPDTDLLLAGARVDPIDASLLIKLRGTLNHSALVADSGADGYTLTGVQPLPGADVSYAMVSIGNDVEADPTKAAKNIVLDRFYLQADAVKGGKHGISLHCGNVAVLNSYIDGFWAKEDAQAINGYNGPGPFLIENTYTCASGENVIFGGGTSRSEGMQPSHLTMRRNYHTKQLAWRGRKDLTVKNCFELKNMLGALIEQEIYEYAWKNGQAGAAILMTPRNQDNVTPWVTVRDILMRQCIIRHCAAGFQLQGDDNEHPSGRMTNVRIEDLLLYDIDPKTWNDLAVIGSDGYGSGRLFQVTRGPVNLTIERVTALGSRLNSILTLDGPTMADWFSLTNSVLTEGKYALLGGEPSVYGAAAWTKFVTNGRFDVNLIARTGLGIDKLTYPGTNVISALSEAVTDANFNVLPKYARAGLGCDLSLLPAR